MGRAARFMPTRCVRYFAQLTKLAGPLHRAKGESGASFQSPFLGPHYNGKKYSRIFIDGSPGLLSNKRPQQGEVSSLSAKFAARSFVRVILITSQINSNSVGKALIAMEVCFLDLGTSRR